MSQHLSSALSQGRGILRLLSSPVLSSSPFSSLALDSVETKPALYREAAARSRGPLSPLPTGVWLLPRRNSARVTRESPVPKPLIARSQL